MESEKRPTLPEAIALVRERIQRVKDEQELADRAGKQDAEMMLWGMLQGLEGRLRELNAQLKECADAREPIQ